MRTPIDILIFEFNRRRSSPEEFAAYFHAAADSLYELEREVFIAGFIAAAPEEVKTETLREIADKEFDRKYNNTIAGIDFGEALDILDKL